MLKCLVAGGNLGTKMAELDFQPLEGKQVFLVQADCVALDKCLTPLSFSFSSPNRKTAIWASLCGKTKSEEMLYGVFPCPMPPKTVAQR